MGPTEYVLLALVILIPLVVAAAVTAWSLEQVRARSKKNRKRPQAPQNGPKPEPQGEG